MAGKSKPTGLRVGGVDISQQVLQDSGDIHAGGGQSAEHYFTDPDY